MDHELGNPLFLRLPRSERAAWRDRFADIASGRLNLYATFVRRALEEVPAGRLVGYAVPASFLGGPEFSAFRHRVLQLAEVLVGDAVEKHSDVFLDAIRDACFVVLQRRSTPLEMPPTSVAQSGVLRRDGRFVPHKMVELGPDGLPWRLPGVDERSNATLIDWGYRGSIGYLVANRQPERLHDRHTAGRFPLIWAKAVTTEGLFDFARGAAFKNRGWVSAPADAAYVVRQGCVAVQRTSSRGQKRRLNAAAIPEALARALNEAGASAELDRVCGSASTSVRLLERIPLREPPTSQGQAPQ